MAKKTHGSEHIFSAALDLAADRGWRGVSLADIAARSGVPLADLAEQFPSKTAILDGYARHIDRRMMDGAVDMGESARDRLFEVVMRRFDAMSPHRKGLASALRDGGADPWALACGARRFVKAMALTLETAGISSSGLAGLARVEGLGAAYLYVLRTFLDDDSADLARTMAALDTALRRAEDVAAMVWRRPVAASASPTM
jgi:AcrR family transcriptional regulator